MATRNLPDGLAVFGHFLLIQPDGGTRIRVAIFIGARRFVIAVIISICFTHSSVEQTGVELTAGLVPADEVRAERVGVGVIEVMDEAARIGKVDVTGIDPALGTVGKRYAVPAVPCIRELALCHRDRGTGGDAAELVSASACGIINIGILRYRTLYGAG